VKKPGDRRGAALPRFRSFSVVPGLVPVSCAYPALASLLQNSCRPPNRTRLVPLPTTRHFVPGFHMPPLRGWRSGLSHRPRTIPSFVTGACALGCILSPLCGWGKRGNRRNVHRLFPSMSRQQKNGERPVCPRIAGHSQNSFPRLQWACYMLEIAYFAPGTGPMTKMVLPDGSSKSNVLAPHSSSFGDRKTSTFELHSR